MVSLAAHMSTIASTTDAGRGTMYTVIPLAVVEDEGGLDMLANGLYCFTNRLYAY